MPEGAATRIDLQPELGDRLETVARAVDRSAQSLAEEAIERYLDLHDWQIARVQEGIEAADRGDFASDSSMELLLAKFSAAR